MYSAAQLLPRLRDTCGFAAVVGSNGIEPSTSRLSGVRSNRLSYEPAFNGDGTAERALKVKQCGNETRSTSGAPAAALGRSAIFSIERR